MNQSLQTFLPQTINNNILTTEEEIDKIIQRHTEEKKLYSKTYIEQSYTPLSPNEKQKFLQDMSTDSDKRLKLYSNLFNEIKSQINYISDNINKKKEPIMNKILEENEVMDFSLEVQKSKQRRKFSQKGTKLIKNNSCNKENLTIMTNLTVQENPDLLEEDKSRLVVPVIEYKSNHLQDLDYLSNPKAYSYSVTGTAQRESERKYKLNYQ